MKKTLTQQDVDDFFASRFTKSSHSDELIHKFSSKYMKISHAVIIASFNLSKVFEVNREEFGIMATKAIGKLDYVSKECLMNMYKAYKPVWGIFEKNVKTEWTSFSALKSAYNNSGFKDEHFMSRLSIWADETGRRVNIKRIGLTKKIIASEPTKELPWLKQ